MTTTETAPRMPFDRPNLLEVAPLYEVLRREGPIVPVRTPAGDPAWLVTRYDQARDLWGDPRLGRSHPAPEDAAKISDAAVMGGPSGSYETEEADHTRMRKLLVPAFSAKRMRLLGDHVQSLVDGCIDAMVAVHDASADGVVDLHEHLSFPLPVAVICELLGVPYADRGYFSDLSDRISRMSGGDDARVAQVEFAGYMAELAAAKRVEPGEDVISDLVAGQIADPTFTDADLATLATGLLFAGHETTVNRIDLGVIMLLTHTGHRDALAADPDGLVNTTVEEILRLSAPGGLGLVRYAHVDVEVGGVTIPRGDAVILSAPSANRDTDAFTDADDFDPTRRPNPHLSFGHGMHFCIGASLARTELRSVFTTLFQRLPGLTLAADVADLDVRSDNVTGGISALPVTW